MNQLHAAAASIAADEKNASNGVCNVVVPPDARASQQPAEHPKNEPSQKHPALAS